MCVLLCHGAYVGDQWTFWGVGIFHPPCGSNSGHQTWKCPYCQRHLAGPKIQTILKGILLDLSTIYDSGKGILVWRNQHFTIQKGDRTWASIGTRINYTSEDRADPQPKMCKRSLALPSSSQPATRSHQQATLCNMSIMNSPTVAPTGPIFWHGDKTASYKVYTWKPYNLHTRAHTLHTQVSLCFK